MAIDLQGRSFLKLLDFTSDEIRHLIDLSAEFKKLKHDGIEHAYLRGKDIVLIFEKTSTRTRCSFEVAGADLGMGVTYLEPGTSQMGKKESIEDTACVLGRLYDGIEYRGFSQQTVEDLARYSGVPVYNGLTDEFHPTQMIADMLTIYENFGRLEGLKFVFMGDARNNVANSLMVACAKLGLHFVACAPRALFPAKELVETCQEIAAQNGTTITLTDNVEEAVCAANIIYTDIWVSMGEPQDIWASRIEELRRFQVNAKIMKLAAPDAIFMHCLPSFHDTHTEIGARIAKEFGIGEMEVTDAVFRSAQSRVFEEAENRMHSIKAILYATLSGPA